METNENRGWREAEKEKKREQFLEKEKKLIEEEVQVEEEVMEESIYDDLLIYIGLGFIALGCILLLVDNFSFTLEVKSLLILGSFIFMFGLLWRFFLSRQIGKKQKEIQKLEEEIEQI